MAGQTGPGAPSEAELQMMLAQMREAPAEQILVEVVNVLLQAVQVKLGRPDARLLLDVVAGVASAAKGRADTTLLTQVEQAIGQLRLAQVEAESRTPEGTDVGPADPAQPAAPQRPAAAAAAPTGSPQPPDGSEGRSRLWVPGR